MIYKLKKYDFYLFNVFDEDNTSFYKQENTKKTLNDKLKQNNIIIKSFIITIFLFMFIIKKRYMGRKMVLPQRTMMFQPSHFVYFYIDIKLYLNFMFIF